jgi:hypothetical protein
MPIGAPPQQLVLRLRLHRLPLRLVFVESLLGVLVDR